jgi:hypothetical protein
MRRRWLVAALALFAAVVLVLPAAANARLRPLFAVMSQPNVDPEVAGGGSFTAVIDNCALPAVTCPPSDPPPDKPWFCYGIALKDLASPLIVGRYTAHVHVGDEVIMLGAPWTVNPGSSSGCMRVDKTLAEALADTQVGIRGPHYVDVHSMDSTFLAARGLIFAENPDPPENP